MKNEEVADPTRCNLVDWARIDALRNGTPGSEERVRQLIGIFLETSRKSVTKIRSLGRVGRSEEMGKALHKLKGGCGTVGARRMFILLRTLEAENESDRTEPMDPLLEQLELDLLHTGEMFELRGLR